MDLDRLLQFTSFLHKFQHIKRTILVTGEDRNENDMEHVGQLALLAWYVIEKDNLGLDKEKVFEYALAHDLVEVYAGDTWVYDAKGQEGKKEREEKAILQIQKEFPETEALCRAAQGYIDRTDEESKFVYVLDKLTPIMNMYLDGGKTWRRDKVKLQMLRDYKDKKVELFPHLKKYYDAIIKILQEKESELFYTS